MQTTYGMLHKNGTELWASWHFTMDDKYLYQHLPETERGFHAGDITSKVHI